MNGGWISRRGVLQKLIIQKWQIYWLLSMFVCGVVAISSSTSSLTVCVCFPFFCILIRIYGQRIGLHCSLFRISSGTKRLGRPALCKWGEKISDWACGDAERERETRTHMVHVHGMLAFWGVGARRASVFVRHRSSTEKESVVYGTGAMRWVFGTSTTSFKP